jgi:hypothetical protein
MDALAHRHQEPAHSRKTFQNDIHSSIYTGVCIVQSYDVFVRFMLSRRRSLRMWKPAKNESPVLMGQQQCLSRLCEPGGGQRVARLEHALPD